MASITINNLNASTTSNLLTGNNVLPIYQGNDNTGDTFKITPANLVAKTLNMTTEEIQDIKNIVAPSGALSQNKFLAQTGEWRTPADLNTTYGLATSTTNGLMTSAHYSTVEKLGAITLATSQLRGYMSADDKKKLDNLTTATATTGAKGYVPQLPQSGGNTMFLRGDGSWAYPNGTTYGDATSSSKGLMTAAQFKKLESIASSATRNVFSAVAGYPTGNQTPSFGGTFNIYQVGQTTAGAITHTTRTVTIPNSVAAANANGLMTSTDKTRLDALHAITDATTSTHGYMTAADKIKVNKMNSVWYRAISTSAEGDQVQWWRYGDIVLFYTFGETNWVNGTAYEWSIPAGFRFNQSLMSPAWPGLLYANRDQHVFGHFRISIKAGSGGKTIKGQAWGLPQDGVTYSNLQGEASAVWLTNDSFPDATQSNITTYSRISY